MKFIPTADAEDKEDVGFYHSIFKMHTARLSRRVVFWVFISVILIETIIFIPSFKNRQQELLKQKKEVTKAWISTIFAVTDPEVSDNTLLSRVKKLQNSQTILGGVLYDADDKRIGAFGELPELDISDVKRGGRWALLSRDNMRYDIACSLMQSNRGNTLIIRHDSASVRQELYAFFIRIAVLVVIISLFVTAGTWIALGPLVITPVLQLRRDMLKAGEAISKDQPPPAFYSEPIRRQDELGEVIAAFKRMYQQIAEAVKDRKEAEAALKESYRKIADYSRALNKELEKGREIQKNFLPSHLLQLQGWETAAFFRPARQISGDFYDFFELPDNRIGLVIADVCDKGVGSALFMALFRSLIRVYSLQSAQGELVHAEESGISVELSADLEETALNSPQIKALNAVLLSSNYIAQHHGDLCMFATLFFGVLEPSTGVLTYINGGHVPLFTIGISGGMKSTLEPTGPVVGIESDIHFKIQQTRLDPGDILLGYTDGVTEARTASGEIFTHDKLLSMLEPPAASATELIENIATSVTTHTGEAEQYDDITMIAIRRVPQG